jgi:cytochrome c oxidase subunit 3
MTSDTAAGSAGYHERTAFIGMTIFMASWAMLFAGLFFAYGVTRIGAVAWPPADLPRLPRLLPGLATLVLGLSSLALHRGHRVGLAVTLGSGFLALQCIVWRDLFTQGLTPQAGGYGSTFFGLTAFHALHVLLGLAALGVLGIQRRGSDGEFNTGLRLWTLYWHGVGAIWGVMFVLVYLV